jgi:phage tail-like protein
VVHAEPTPSWFSLELDNGVRGCFDDTSGRGLTAEISLERTLGSDRQIWHWAKSIRDGSSDFCSQGAAVLHDFAGEEIGRWKVENCWPSRWSVSDPAVGTDDPIREAVTLQLDRLEHENTSARRDTRDHGSDFHGSFFALEVDGDTLGYFRGCSGLSLEFDVTTATEGGGPPAITHKRPGKPKYAEVVLKRGFTPDRALFTWFDAIVSARDATPDKSGSIVIYDRRQKAVTRFDLARCWPSQLTASDLSAGPDEVMVEAVTIQHERLDWP